MNLTTDPWVPVVRDDGRPEIVSLVEAFTGSAKIRDLTLRPHERIAVMRLLICIAQAALDGPEDDEEWVACQPRIAPRVLEYLSRWRQAFELFGEGQRFLQAGNLRKPAAGSRSRGEDEATPTSKLDPALSTGANTTLFDNAGGPGRAFGEAWLALQLLTFQCFSPCGTIGVALWNEEPTNGWSAYPKVKPGSSGHAPCMAGNLLHCFLRGKNLLDSVHSNLLTKQRVNESGISWGEPVWHSFPSGPRDSAAARNATATYLGRLTPVSRAIRLAEGGCWMTLANGLEYPAYPEWRDPAATIVTGRADKKPHALGAFIARATWRELHALTVIAADRGSNGGPLALANIPSDRDFDLWAGGLVAKGNNKLIDATESMFHVPAAMLRKPAQRAYESGVRYAEAREWQLKRAITIYHTELGEKLDRPQMKNRRLQLQGHAATQFWTDIEQAVPLLLEAAGAPGSLGLEPEWQKAPWGRAVWSAASQAYERACPHATPRQMRAYALGLQALFATLAETEPAETENEGES